MKNYITLFLTWMSLSLIQVQGQTQTYRFQYREVIKSDYSDLMTLGKDGTIKKDSLAIDGVLKSQFIDDSTRWLVVKISNQHALGRSSLALPFTFSSYVRLDSNYRVIKVMGEEMDLRQLTASLSWLGELNFRVPSKKGLVAEAKVDGDYSSSYELSRNKDQIIFSKNRPQFLAAKKTTQALVFQNYSWSAIYPAEGKAFSNLQMQENKTQFLGRKALACISRELKLVEEKGDSPISSPGLNLQNENLWHPLYQRINLEERRRNISLALLGNSDFEELILQTQSASSLGNEARFRLKSKWRSLFILDSSTIKKAIDQLPDSLIGGENIIMAALIECKQAAAYNYLADKISAFSNYEHLKDLLIQLSIAESFNTAILNRLISLLGSSSDQNTQTLVALSLSNFALLLKKEQPAKYSEICNALLRHTPLNKDTLQYLYVVGNAGMEEDLGQLSILMRTRFEADAVNALRNIYTVRANRLIIDYYKEAQQLNPNFYTILLKARPLTEEWINLLTDRILSSEAKGDSSQLAALQFLLDQSHQQGVNLEKILNHSYKSEAYQREIQSYLLAGDLCRREL